MLVFPLQVLVHRFVAVEVEVAPGAASVARVVPGFADAEMVLLLT